MTSKKQKKVAYNLLNNIYGGFFFKKKNENILLFRSRLFNEPMFEYYNGVLKFKDELLFNSIFCFDFLGITYIVYI